MLLMKKHREWLSYKCYILYIKWIWKTQNIQWTSWSSNIQKKNKDQPNPNLILSRESSCHSKVCLFLFHHISSAQSRFNIKVKHTLILAKLIYTKYHKDKDPQLHIIVQWSYGCGTLERRVIIFTDGLLAYNTDAWDQWTMN